MKATKNQLIEFKSSMIWQDICEELNKLSNFAQLEYDIVGEPHVDDEGHKIVPNESETLIHLGDIKGRRKAVSYFLQIPDVLINLCEEESLDKNQPNLEANNDDTE